MAEKRSFLQFLKENRVDNIRKEVTFPRLKGYNFVIKPISMNEYNDIETSAVVTDKRGRVTVNSGTITEQIIKTALIEPDFTDDSFLRELGANSVMDAIDKVLLAGEISTLRNEIMKLSGLSGDFEEEVTEAKNE